MANISQIKLPDNVTYDLVDKTSGYVTTNTKNTTGSSDYNTRAKLYIVGAPSQSTYTQTYSRQDIYISKDGVLHGCGGIEIQQSSENEYRGVFTFNTTFAADRVYYMPDKTGTLALLDDLPDISGKIDTAGTGLTKVGTKLNHSNSITAQTTSGIYPIKIDAQGHITEYDTAVTIPTKTSDLTNDSNFITGMTILSYGSSTYAEALAAYQANKIIYCRASSNSNPGTGNQLRMAFLAYVNNQTTPTEFEFQYYRSVSTHSDSQQGDQVYVYKLNSSSTWSVTTREAYTKMAVGVGLDKSYSSGTFTAKAKLNSETSMGTIGTTDGLYAVGVDSNGKLCVSVTGTGTVTSVGLSNDTNGGLSISGSPITSSGTITIGHTNVLASAQTTLGVYPIKIDKNGHITEYGSAVTIPTNTSDLNNDSRFIAEDVNGDITVTRFVNSAGVEVTGNINVYSNQGFGGSVACDEVNSDSIICNSIETEDGGITAAGGDIVAVYDSDSNTGGNITTTGGDLSVLIDTDSGLGGNILCDGDITDGSGNVLSAKANKTDLPSVLTYYGACTQSGTGRDVSVSDSTFSLTRGVVVGVKFSNAITSTTTINVASKGAKSVYYRGSALNSAGVINAGDLATLQYDGTNWNVLSVDRRSTVQIDSDSEVSLGGLYIKRGVSVKDNISVAASSYADNTTSLSVSGYTLLGVLGFYVVNGSSSGSGGMNAIVNQCYVSAANTVTYRISNKSTSALKVRIYMDLLYYKS